jgi:hypothetical protein
VPCCLVVCPSRRGCAPPPPLPVPCFFSYLCHVDPSAWSAEDVHGDHGRPSAVSSSSESEDEDEGEGEDEGGMDTFDHGVDLPLHEGGEGDLDSVRLSCTHCRCTDVEPGTEFCPQCGTCSVPGPSLPLVKLCGVCGCGLLSLGNHARAIQAARCTILNWFSLLEIARNDLEDPT